MPASYHSVSPSIWDRTMRGLSPEAQVVDLYVRTCRTKLTEGLYELAPPIIAADTGMDVTDVEGALDELEDAGRLHIDLAVEVVLDPLALPTMRAITSDEDNRVAGAVNRLKMIPATPLQQRFLKLAEEYAPPLVEPLREAWDLPTEEGPSEDLQRPSEGSSRAEQRRGEGETESSPSGVEPAKSRTWDAVHEGDNCYSCGRRHEGDDDQALWQIHEGAPYCSVGCVPDRSVA